MVQGHRHVDIEVCVSTPKVTSALASGLSAPIIVTFAQLLSMCSAHFTTRGAKRERTIL
jgi:hypothetical protein